MVKYKCIAWLACSGWCVSLDKVEIMAKADCDDIVMMNLFLESLLFALNSIGQISVKQLKGKEGNLLGNFMEANLGS